MGVIWGIPYLLIKVAVRAVEPSVLVLARTGVGALVLVPIALHRDELRPVLARWKPLLVYTAIEIAGPWLLLSTAEQRISSSLAGLLIAAVPIIGVVVARLTGGTERLSPRRWTGLIIGLAGVAVLAAPDLGSGNGWAIGEVLLVAVCYASAPLIATRKLADIPALPMTAACLTLAALVYTPSAAVTWPRQLPSVQVLAALAGLGVICTAFAFIVFLELLKEVGTSRGMVFTYVNPAVAVAAGVAVLGEPFTATIAVSFALILGGCLLATAAQRDQRPAPEPAAPAGPPPVRADRP